jgi:EmrB/QacA subfamily drug resistance transporter
VSQVNVRATKLWVLALASAASCMVALDALVVSTALTAIRADLSTSLEALQWTVSAYNLSFGILILTGAALGDRFGRRRMFAAGIVLFAIASAACALSADIGQLIAARTAQGAGAALVMPLAMALLTAAYAPNERGKALGIFSSVAGIALIGGPVLGGMIAQGINWRWIFWINLPFAAMIVPLVLRHIPESRGPGEKFDGAGLAIGLCAALALALGLMRGNRAGWDSTEVVISLGLGLVLASAFVGWERSIKSPMMPMRLFATPTFAAGVFASFLFYAAMYGVLFFLPQFLQIAQGHGALAAGLRLLPWTATLFLVAPIAGSLVNRLGERSLVVVGLTMQALGFTWIAGIATPKVGYVQLIAPMVPAGTGVTMAMPAAQSAVMKAALVTEIGKASGIFNSFRFLGGVFGVAVLGIAFSESGSIGSAQSFSDGFVGVCYTAAVLSLAGAVVALGLPTRQATASAEATSTTS